MVELAVALEIVADRGIRRYANVLVENRAADARAAADVAVVENNRVFDVGVGVDPHAASDHRSRGPSRRTGSSPPETMESSAWPAAAVVIEDEFGRGVEVAGRAQRPLAVVEIQLRRDRAQVHVGVEVGVQGSHVSPVNRCAGRIARNPVGLKIVGEHLRAADQAAAECRGRNRASCARFRRPRATHPAAAWSRTDSFPWTRTRDWDRPAWWAHPASSHGSR